MKTIKTPKLKEPKMPKGNKPKSVTGAPFPKATSCNY